MKNNICSIIIEKCYCNMISELATNDVMNNLNIITANTGKF